MYITYKNLYVKYFFQVAPHGALCALKGIGENRRLASSANLRRLAQRVHAARGGSPYRYRSNSSSVFCTPT